MGHIVPRYLKGLKMRAFFMHALVAQQNFRAPVLDCLDGRYVYGWAGTPCPEAAVLFYRLTKL